jgi:DNA modification methylase
MSYRILSGDCVARMGMLNPESIDNIITDPPYEIGFMGKGWDSSGVAYNPVTWKAAHRVLKPNGIMLVFGATRTHHRIAHAIERAGFEIIDIVAWTYGTGFPKSHNISKAIDKNAGAKRKVIGQNKNHRSMKHTNSMVGEPHSGDGSITASSTPDAKQWEGWGTALKPAWEPVLIARKKGSSRTVENYSQFHYISKASKKEKNAGLDNEPQKMGRNQSSLDGGKILTGSGNEGSNEKKNFHPTVKPIKLMKALIEEFTEEGSIVFDPFTGSGSTGIASVLLNREFIGCELTPEYIPLAKARIEYAINDGELFE